jgi:hypothetical protein
MSGRSCGGRSGYPAVPRDSVRAELVVPLLIAPPALLMAPVIARVSSLGGDEGASGAGDRNDGAVNYPALPRSGPPAPRLLRTGLSGSASELTSNVDTTAPDSAGDFP